MGADARAPEDVFTPTTPPERAMFTRRNEPDARGNPGLQDRVREALREPGRQLLLYGDPGVGKTTLLKYAAEDEEMKLLLVPCTVARSFDLHVQAALNQLVTQRAVSVTRGTSRGRSAEGGFSKFITLKRTSAEQQEESRQFESTTQEPILELAAALRRTGRRLVVFDNFQNVDRDDVRFFAQAAEVLSDVSAETGDVKMVIVAAAEDARAVIGDSGSLQRRITEIGVPRMPDSEIDELLVNGFDLLALKLLGDAKARLIYLSDGFPYFAHTLGLHIARQARRTNVAEVDRDQVDAALERAVEGVEASYDGRIRQALERSGEKQPRRRILQLLATSDERDWTAAKVVGELAAGPRSASARDDLFRTALSQLVKPEYGAVLRRSGSPGTYRYRFADPFLRPYLRMKHFPERLGPPPGVELPIRTTRRTVTIVFCDITDTTGVAERLDPEQLRGVVSTYVERARAAFVRHGGTVEKFIGDSLMVVFGVPIVHEDDALRAVRAAEDARTEIAALAQADYLTALEPKIGVNTGEVLAGSDPSLGISTGDAVNVAARLAQSAPPGGILLAAATHRLVRGAVDVQPALELRLRGKSGPVVAYPLAAVHAATAHEPARARGFVDRARELTDLRASLAEAVTASNCRLVMVVGEPGIGKTRLVEEFIASSTEVRVLRGRCLPYGEDITYWPLREMIRDVVGLEHWATNADVHRGAGALLGAAEEAATLARIVSQDGAEEHVVVAGARALFEAVARERPLVAVFDDLQWADEKLLELIAHVADQSRGVPLLLCCLARPEFLDTHPRWVALRPSARTVFLAALSEGDVYELTRQRLGGEVSEEVERRVTAAAGGNPLFAEELIRMLIESGEAVQEELAWHLTATPPRREEIPPTIASILAARLDRLRPDDRIVLERAAVAGATFSAGMVAALVPADLRNSVGECLDRLVRQRIVIPVRSPQPHDELLFAHKLLHDAAYASIPKLERAQLHEQLARWLEARRPPDTDAAVGYHLDKAARLRREVGLREPPDV